MGSQKWFLVSDKTRVGMVEARLTTIEKKDKIEFNDESRARMLDSIMGTIPGDERAIKKLFHCDWEVDTAGNPIESPPISGWTKNVQKKANGNLNAIPEEQVNR